MIRTWPFRILRAALVAAAVIMVAGAMGLADRFIYFPMRHPDGYWSELASSGAEERWVQTADGIRLNAWWFRNPDTRIATLFFHGNAGNVTHRVGHALAMRDAGSAFYVVDYRGYGKSGGKANEAGLYADATAAYDDLRAIGYAPNQIVIHGESLGAAVATELATRKPCAGLVLESPFISVARMAGSILPGLGPLLARGFDNSARVPAIHAPLLVVHGDADSIIPFSHGEAVFARANSPKTFYRVRRGDHNSLLDDAGPEYVARLKAFYDSLPR